jgi:hypothetical protein
VLELDDQLIQFRGGVLGVAAFRLPQSRVLLLAVELLAVRELL